MLYPLAPILIIAWRLEVVSNYTLGGFIHLLPVIAIVTLRVRPIRGDPIDYPDVSNFLTIPLN